jgi:hypothetical protein
MPILPCSRKKDISFAVVVVDQRNNSYMFVYVYSSKQNSVSTVCAVILDNNLSILLPQKKKHLIYQISLLLEYNTFVSMSV